MSLLLRDLIIPAAGPLFFREFEVLFELRKIVETKNDFFFREIELLLFLWSPLSWSSSKLVTEIFFRESENLWIFNYGPIDCRMLDEIVLPNDSKFDRIFWKRKHKQFFFRFFLSEIIHFL